MQQDMLAERSVITVRALLEDGKRERAAIALKKKKLHEKQALQLENNILLLDERAAALETSSQQADLVGALKTATNAIRTVQRQMPLEDVERLMEDNATASQYVVRAVSKHHMEWQSSSHALSRLHTLGNTYHATRCCPSALVFPCAAIQYAFAGGYQCPAGSEHRSSA